MSSPPAPVVHVVDDDPAIRTSLSSLLRSLDMAVETHSSAEAFLARTRGDQPECLLLDVNLPGASGVELQDVLNRLGDAIPIVFLTGFGTIPMTVSAMRAGATEFLTKPFTEEQLLAAIRSASTLAADQWQGRSARGLVRQRIDSLSPREREVFLLVVAGQKNKVIAAQLGITEITVKVHRRHVMEKLQVGTVADLVRLAEQLRADEGRPAAYTKV